MKPFDKIVRSAVVALAAAMHLPAAAQDAYPSRPVTLIVPHPAGGYTDSVGRLIADGLSKRWHSPVIVENRAGAGGSIGTAYAARRDPDGYTLFLSSTGTDVINRLLYKNLEVDPAVAFEPVILGVKTPNTIVVNNDFPAKSISEMISLAKANPGKFNMGNPGTGTNSQFTGALFLAMNGLEVTEIPYKGSAAVLTDVVNGNLQIAVDNVMFWAPQVKSGSARALAVTGLKRSPLLPDVPTLDESGMPGFEATTFTGISVPSGTPAALVEKINAAIQEVLASNEFRSKMGVGEIVGGPPRDFKEYLAAERAKWGKVAASLDIKMQ